MAEIKQTQRASKVLNDALECCKRYRHEFIMPEHLLSVLIEEENFKAALQQFQALIKGLITNIEDSGRREE